ncbi:peptidylprolyl isomerase [Stigmatella sp. ncwal1]|uniref:Peptidylprolyl isomerase n=1 Tax=Stigmatella ashevillensis TaxID=2995309 RepID=A0ABT5DF04_9BACT|nr:peptidylprolyl isomerase [Stigmatella ashevillena]MDC0712260.1 peptidylprolyl isomerase [Stigmatella ashevillena]
MRICLWVIASMGVACTSEAPFTSGPADAGQSSGTVVGRFAQSETLTEEDVSREAARLPPALREQFETPSGRREFARSLIDKRLLVLEAQRRKLTEDPEIRRQVRELEERLVVQALLAQEEAAAGRPSEQELRAWFTAHRDELLRPEQVRLGRVLVSVGSKASEVERNRARRKAEALAARLRRGEPLAQVAKESDGPERMQGGELGLVTRGGGQESSLEQAAFALERPGAVSPVVAVREGFAVIQLIERKPPRVPAFEEVAAEVEGRLAPTRKRQMFDALLSRLRQQGGVELVESRRAP